MPHRIGKYACKNPSSREAHEAFQIKQRIDEIMDNAIIAGIREDKHSLEEADKEYFALKGRHVHQDIRKYLSRLEHDAQSYVVSQHIRQVKK